MTISISKHLPGLICKGIITFLICAPLLTVTIDSILSINSIKMEAIIPGSRAAILLGKSVLFSLTATVTGCFIAIPAASILADIAGNPGKFFRLLAVSPIAVPPYIHALAWQYLVEYTGLSAPPMILAFWVETVTRLPILVAATLIGLITINPLAKNAAQIYATPIRSFLQINLPLASPAIIAGSCIALIFSLNEYSLPLLFQHHTYALEIFSVYSGSGNSLNTLITALPLTLLTAITVIIALRKISIIPTPSAINPPSGCIFSGSTLYDTVRISSLCIIGCQFIIPVWATINIASGNTSTLFTAANTTTIFDSIILALTTTVFSLPCAWVLAEHLHKKPGKLIWLVILLGLSLPASLIGSGTIKLWGWLNFSTIYNGWALYGAGMIVRLIPLSTLLLYSVLRSSDSMAWDAARVFRNGPALWIKIRLFQIWPGLAAAFILGFAFSISEMELSLMLSPPGSTGVGVRILNYLHYGAFDQVAWLALTILGTTLLLGGALYHLTSAHSHKQPDKRAIKR